MGNLAVLGLHYVQDSPPTCYRRDLRTRDVECLTDSID